jgi:cytochrome c
MKMNLVYFTLLAIMSFMLSPVYANEGEKLYQAKGCATCHGVAGISAAPIWPNIAGQHKPYLLAQMKDIKSGKRNNGMSITMKGIVAGISDDELEKIADWLSKLK